MKIGLSLSKCVKDIIEKRVKLGDVTCIISNTCACDDYAMERVVLSYSKTFWSHDINKARCVVHILRNHGRLVQPRLVDPNYKHQAKPHWIDVPS